MHPDSPLSPRASLSLTWGLALFLVLNAFAFNGALWLAQKAAGLEDRTGETAVHYKGTVLNHSWDVLHGRGCDDSWGIMAFALEYTEAPHPTPLYTELFFNRKLKFQYPLSSLFTVSAMLRVAREINEEIVHHPAFPPAVQVPGPMHVRTDECQEFPTPPINDILGWVFILVSALSSAALLEIGLRRWRKVESSAAAVIGRGIVVLGLAFTFYPMMKAFTLGQIQLWINGVFALAILAWAIGWKASSGVAIGLMCLIKPHYGAFVLWGLLRREWRFTVACFATVAAGLGAALVVFGWTDNIDYLKVFWFLSRHGETYYPNQSVNGVLNRIMTLIDPATYSSIDFDSNSFPPFNLWIYLSVLVTALIIVALALFRRGRERDPDRTLDFSAMALSITMASPIAWEHHYGIVLPIFAVMLARSLGQRSRLVWLMASYGLISNFIPAANLLAPTVANIVQSYLLAGAIILLALLYRSRSGQQAASPAGAAAPAGVV